MVDAFASWRIMTWAEAAAAKRSFARPRDVGPARPERSTLLSNRRAPRLKERFNYFGGEPK